MLTEAEVEQGLYQFTVTEYHQMGEAGIFTENDRIELINGRIYTMSPIGRKHFACVARLTKLFTMRLADAAIVSVQNPVILNDRSEPEPDIAVLRPRDDFYEAALPNPADVLLLIEVSEATLRFDKEVKLPLYAQSGIPEVWIINLKTPSVEVYTDPQEGGYGQLKTLKRGQNLTPTAFPLLTFGVSDLMGE
ncbi:Uma2 family endonuclease [Rudanella lutea]|jgi:Uma2 family endonuclease|uniref:Uma2 family endonuclease n=1 Tax=Rudanella lutea TaxID=451374 RepID=UPI00035F8EA7|nr:Uma2 family endonuclease [Rudanella lutea]